MKDVKFEVNKVNPELLKLVDQLGEQVDRLRAEILAGGAQDCETPMISQIQVLRLLPAVSPRSLGRWRAAGIIGGAVVPGRQGIWYTHPELQQIKRLLAAGRTHVRKKNHVAIPRRTGQG